MRKLLLTLFTLFVFVTQQAQTAGMASSNENIYGTWQSWDGTSILYMNYSDEGDTFYRMSDVEDGREVAEGKFTIEDKFLFVEKVNENYKLLFYLKGMQLIVMKPDSAGGVGQAWLFQKVSDYGLSK